MWIFGHFDFFEMALAPRGLGQGVGVNMKNEALPQAQAG